MSSALLSLSDDDVQLSMTVRDRDKKHQLHCCAKNYRYFQWYTSKNKWLVSLLIY